MVNKILPSVTLEVLPPEKFSEYLQLFQRGDLGNTTPPKDVEQMHEMHSKYNYSFFRVTNNSDFEGVKKGAVIGACAINFWDANAYFSNQFVFSEFRKKGFGNAVRVELEKIAREKSAVFVGANIHWRDLQQFKRLLKAGYRPVPSSPFMRFEKKTYLRFRKRL